MLCNWCAPQGIRTEAQLRADPKAIIAPNGEVFGIGGEGQVHDTRYVGEQPPACWYPNSGRVIV